MLIFVVKRLVSGLVLALLVTAITFFLLSLSFETVVRNLLGSGATDESVAGMLSAKGLDRPVIVQYLDWLRAAFALDFGRSYFTSEPVGPAVLSRLGVTMSIVVVALIATTVISVILGVAAATRGGVVDRFAQIGSLVALVLPALLLAIGLVLVFAVQFEWLPATGYTPLHTDPIAWARSITLPVVILAIGGIANITAQVRGSMIDEVRKDYVRTLTTRGIGTRSIVVRHALRNAAVPALTVLSLEFIGMIGGALIIEKIFALPGFGSFAFAASLQGDIPVIMAVTLFSVLLVVAVTVIVDLLISWLNPKARSY
jgi:peptide/nickel transport system permease protein